MEAINQVIKKVEQRGNNSNNSSNQNSVAVINKQPLIQKDDSGSYYISKYQKQELTDDCILKCVAKIKAMFPALPIEFYGVFIDRIKEKGFCNERLIDAVNHVIDNCQYPTPTAANFLSFDKKSKIYTYQEILSLVDKGDSFSNYTIITINNKKFWDRK